jgi:ABC-type transport system substrate-binding protein
MVEAGDLPPLEERLPDEPLVVEPTDTIGVYGGSLRNGVVSTNVNPYIFTLAQYDNLLRWDEEWTGAAGSGELVPNLATSFEANDDATEFTFELREGMRWSDGEPYTAHDIVFALEDVLLNDELTPSSPGWLMTPDGSNARQVTRNGAANFAPFFHPDGRRIIFSSNLHQPGGRAPGGDTRITAHGISPLLPRTRARLAA